MREAEMKQVGKWIADALAQHGDVAVLAKIKRQVLELAEEFPLYAERRAQAQAEVRA
jgi:glycine hydroxymethyltransferase